MTNNATLIAINGLAGLALAPTASLATLPVTCWVVGGGDRHHAGVEVHEESRAARRPDPRRLGRDRRRGDLRGRHLAGEFLAAVLRRAGLGNLQRVRPVLPLRRRRGRAARFPRHRGVAGARRRAGRRHRRAHLEPVHGRPCRPEVRRGLPGADRLRARHDGDPEPDPDSRPDRGGAGGERPSAVGNRGAAQVHRRRHGRRHQLRRDEFPHDLDADRDGRVRASLRRRGVRHFLPRDRRCSRLPS